MDQSGQPPSQPPSTSPRGAQRHHHRHHHHLSVKPGPVAPPSSQSRPSHAPPPHPIDPPRPATESHPPPSSLPPTDPSQNDNPIPINHAAPHVPEDDAPTCVICLEAISPTASAELRPCRHREYHSTCVATWLRSAKQCPLCKTDVVSVAVGGADGDLVPAEAFGSPPSPPTALLHPPPPTSSSTTTSSRRHDPHVTPDDDIPIELTDRRMRAAVRVRALVYEHGLLAYYVAATPVTGYLATITPEIVRARPALVDRARRWLRRELLVFPHLHRRWRPPDTNPPPRRHRAIPTRATVLLEYLAAALRTFDLQGSRGEAEDYVQEFIGRRAACVILHELRSWLRSPCRTLAEWDAHVRYARGVSLPSSRRADDEWIARWRRLRDEEGNASGATSRRRRREEEVVVDEDSDEARRRRPRRRQR